MTELCYGRVFDEKGTCGYRLVKSQGRTVCLNEQSPHEKLWISRKDGREGYYEYRRMS